MSPNDVTKLIERYNDAWNRQDLDTIASLHHPVPLLPDGWRASANQHTGVLLQPPNSRRWWPECA